MGHFGEFSSQPINRFSSEETKANTTKSDMHWNQRVLYHRVNVKTKLECGPMPNVMVALPNIGGALCSTPQSLPDAHY